MTRRIVAELQPQCHNKDCMIDMVLYAKRKGANLATCSFEEAATYSPTKIGSTIGVSELNFSVRNGKRWNLTAITT